jgi:hypothetical protein
MNGSDSCYFPKKYIKHSQRFASLRPTWCSPSSLQESAATFTPLSARYWYLRLMRPISAHVTAAAAAVRWQQRRQQQQQASYTLRLDTPAESAVTADWHCTTIYCLCHMEQVQHSRGSMRCCDGDAAAAAEHKALSWQKHKHG